MSLAVLGAKKHAIGAEDKIIFFKEIFDNLRNNFQDKKIEIKKTEFFFLPDKKAKAEFSLKEGMDSDQLIVLLEKSLVGVDNLAEARKDFCQTEAYGCLEYRRGSSTVLIVFTNSSYFDRKIYFHYHLF